MGDYVKWELRMMWTAVITPDTSCEEVEAFFEEEGKKRGREVSFALVTDEGMFELLVFVPLICGSVLIFILEQIVNLC